MERIREIRSRVDVAHNPVLDDAQAILADVTQAWAARPADQYVVHEIPCVVDGDRRRGAAPRTTAIRCEPLTAARLDDVRDQLDTWARNLARSARARNTVDALRHDLKRFSRWCLHTGRMPLPASQDTLRAFLEAHADTRKVSTLRRYLASVATLHSAAGLANPTLGEQVRAALDLIARQQAQADQAARAHGRPVRFAKRQAAPLRDADLARADGLFDQSLRGLRDRAIVWLAFDTLARASELAALRVEDFRPVADGQRIVTIHHSKSDQYGASQTRYVSAYTAQRLEAWLRAAHITEGYVLRGIDTRFAQGGRGTKHKQTVLRVRASASRQVIYRAIKQCAARLYAAGLLPFDLSAYSAHSTRVDAAQDMLAEGVSMLAVQQAGGWTTDVMPQQYAREIDALHGGAAQLARKRGRAAAED